MTVQLPIHKPKELIVQTKKLNKILQSSPSRFRSRQSRFDWAKYGVLNKPLAFVMTVLILISQSSILGGGIRTAQNLPLAVGLEYTTKAATRDGYQLRFKQTTRGEIVFTGNSLGLNTFQNVPGSPLNGSIDAYTTTDSTLQVPGFPSGTTTDWRKNSSSATADVPADSLILYAELIWGANFKNANNTLNITSDINTPVTLITPSGATHQIAPDSATSSETDYGYVRSANVTEYIANSTGNYTIKGVPGLIDPLDKSGNYAGWTLAIVYAKGDRPIRNLSLFTGSESVFTNKQNGNVVEINGFGTPLQGAFGAKLFVSAQEGDSDLGGDQLQFGATQATITPISGPNNNANNFFAGQINNSLGQLDTRGTFGNRNQTIGTSQGGRRHGFDITAVDVTDRMSNGQTQAFIKGTSSGDIYVINGLGVQIDVNAPNPIVTITRDKEFIRVGQTITYDITVTNDGVIDGVNPTLNSLIPEGTALVPGSFKVNGSPTNLDPNNPITIANIAPGQTQTYQYSVRVNALPSSGVFENEAFVEYSYTPVAGSPAVTEQTYSSKVVTFPLIPIGLPPVAVDDTGETEPNIPITLPVTNNDTDPDNNLSIPTIIIKTPPQNGTAIVNTTTGESTYTPNQGYTGVDTYEYTICDDQGFCDDATVTITVRAKTPPVANDDSATTKQGVPVTFPIFTNDTDPLNSTIVPTQATVVRQPQHGTITINQTSGEVTYTPNNTTYVGTDSFEYRLCNTDGCDTAVATITITDRIIPIAVDDTSSTKINTPVTIPVTNNDSAGTGQTLNLTSLTLAPNSIPSHGTVTIGSDGSIQYTPNQNYIGTDTFDYAICNSQQECDIARVTVTINDLLPPTANDDVATTQETKPVTIPVVTNDTAGDGTINPSTVTIITPPTNGTTQINPTTGDITYTPNPSFTGNDTLRYSICDSNSKCDEANVVITVAPLTPPNAQDDTAVTDQDVPVIIPVPTNDNQGDTPLDLTSVTILDQPTNGTVVVNPLTGAITYTPSTGFSGNDTFVYQICDQADKCDSANVTVGVNILQPPIANPDTASTLINNPVEIPVLTNDSNPLGALTPTNLTRISAQPTNGTVTINPSTGRILYTPNQDYVGSDTFRYEICNEDGCSTGLVSVDVSRPESPDAVDDVTTTYSDVPVTIPILTNDTAGVGRTLDPTTISITTQPSRGTVTIDPTTNTIRYTPNNGFAGTDTLSYRVCNDADVCDTANVLITVTPPPLPDAVNDEATTPIDTPVLVPILTNDQLPTGTDPANVTFLLNPSNGTIQYNPLTGVTYTPNAGFTGNDRFVYKICTQYNKCDSAEVKITISPKTVPVVNAPRSGQVLGANEKAIATLPRTGGDKSSLSNTLLVLTFILSLGFFTSVYFAKTKKA